MKVAIIGYGFVGKALKNGIKDNVKIFLVDPKLNTAVNDLNSFLPDIVFICVPTPMKNNGYQDISILEQVIEDINKLSCSPQIVLKSTLLPNYLNNIEKLIPGLVYNPEFLRENFANEDFINSELIIFGGREEYTNFLSSFYANYTKCINTNYQFTDLISASLIKYSINTFLATKLIFFNELHDLFKESNSLGTWNTFVSIISKDKRMGISHMQVPGDDGKFGFGGACFPKDCNALYSYSEDIKKPMNLLNKAIEINNSIRKDYKTLSKRELEQNISYNVQKKT